MSRENSTKYLWLEILAVAFLATGGIFVRRCSLSPINCGFYRILFALPFLFLFARKHLKVLQKKDVLVLMASGVFFAADIALANCAYLYTSVTNANLLMNLTPLTVIPVTYLVFRERIPKLYPVGAMLAIFGVSIMVAGKANPTGSNYLGDLMAFGASVFYGLFLLVVYKMRERIPGSVIVFTAGTGSTVALFLFAVFTEGFQIPKNTNDLCMTIGFALCTMVIGQHLMAHCQGRVSVNISSVVGLMQPAFAAIYAWTFFREKMTILEAAGIFVVVLGVFLVKLQYRGKEHGE